MYRHTLIINKRHEMPRSKLWLWDGVTLLLWVGFIYLWHPVLHIFMRIVSADVPSEKISEWISENIHSVTFEHGLTMLIVTPVVLFLLSWLKRHKGPSEHVIYTDEDYASYFRLDADRLHTYRDSQLVTVHHDDRGQITAMEARID